MARETGSAPANMAAPAADEPQGAARRPGRAGSAAPALVRSFLAALSLDRRSIGAARALLGFLLTCDLLHRAGAWFDLYSNHGVYRLPPSGDSSARFFSLFYFFPTRVELGVLFAALLLVYSCLMAGVFARVVTVIAFFTWTSMCARLPTSTNAGYSVIAQLLLWMSFLPTGDRFSVDALRLALRARHEDTAAQLEQRPTLARATSRSPFLGLAAVVVSLQICLIYLDAARTKTGSTWTDLTAVYYALQEQEFATPLAVAVRGAIPAAVYKALCAATHVTEVVIPALVVFPRWWSRMIAVCAIVFLHLGFGTLLLLGPFAWGCCAFAALFIPRRAWEYAASTMRRQHRARVVAVDEADVSALSVARLLARLDAFRLLRFEAGEAGSGLVARRAGGASPAASTCGARALAEAVAALPLGPAIAWSLASPLGSLAMRLAPTLVGVLAALPPLRLPRRFLRSASVARELTVLVLIGSAASFFAASMRPPLEYKSPAPVAWFQSTFWLRQAWYVFAPNPPLATVFPVVEATTIDGRVVDTFTGKPPRVDLSVALPLEGLPQHWVDYLRRIRGVASERGAACDYIRDYPLRTGRREDRIVKARMYELVQATPKFGTRVQPAVKHGREICSFGYPRAGAPEAPPEFDEDP